jgi:hypothetical protein
VFADAWRQPVAVERVAVEKFDAVMACLESAACGAALTQTDQIGANVLLAKRVRLTISRWAQLMLMMGRQLLERLVGGRNHMSSLSFLQGSRLAVRVDRGDEAQQRNKPPARLAFSLKDGFELGSAIDLNTASAESAEQRFGAG